MMKGKLKALMLAMFAGAALLLTAACSDDCDGNDFYTNPRCQGFQPGINQPIPQRPTPFQPTPFQPPIQQPGPIGFVPTPYGPAPVPYGCPGGFCTRDPRLPTNPFLPPV